jgi:hypothetical protein
VTLASGDADYYDLLGVEKTCSESEIKKVLRSRVGFRGESEILGLRVLGVGGEREGMWAVLGGGVNVLGWGSGGGVEG